MCLDELLVPETVARLFQSGPESTDVFWQVYEAIDPGCCVVAENPQTGSLMGSCFYHPREHHVSLGIMNVHPNYFGRGVARTLLKFITDFADQRGYPALRLVSSAMNLDSFSLYTRAGFVPHFVYQDMLMRVPESGLAVEISDAGRIRPATPDDVPAMIQLEMEVAGICREKDYRYFIANEIGIWQSLVYEGQAGGIDAFMVSFKHPSLSMVGPGVARTWQQATSLVLSSLDRYRGGWRCSSCRSYAPKWSSACTRWGPPTATCTSARFAAATNRSAASACPSFCRRAREGLWDRFPNLSYSR